jgi:hypothetical protein
VIFYLVNCIIFSSSLTVPWDARGPPTLECKQCTGYPNCEWVIIIFCLQFLQNIEI